MFALTIWVPENPEDPYVLKDFISALYCASELDVCTETRDALYKIIKDIEDKTNDS